MLFVCSGKASSSYQNVTNCWKCDVITSLDLSSRQIITDVNLKLPIFPTLVTTVVLLQGWELFTDAVIKWINKNLDGVVFLLWGSYAQKKGASIDKV